MAVKQQQQQQKYELHFTNEEALTVLCFVVKPSGGG